jgi:N-acetylglucosamine kinase-like BadF-type ATPase
MLLVVDSGSTKSDWCLVLPDGTRRSYAGKGINPLHVSRGNLPAAIGERMPYELQGVQPEQLFFYGAGCTQASATRALAEALACVFAQAKIAVQPDFLGAARALFGDRSGLVAVLGTGSSCGIYDGRNVVKHSNALGYIVGDEGSAADMGKRLLRAYFYGQLPAALAQQPELQGLTREQMLHAVYHGDAPAEYLAGFSAFLVKNRGNDFVRSLVCRSLDSFFENHVKPMYSVGHRVGVVGSVGFLLADMLREVAQKHGITSLEILRYPIARLASYHYGAMRR